VRWSVSLVAEGDRELTREDIVELADAVAAYDGIASGIGTTSYGVQLVVDAENSEQAVDRAMAAFARAATRAGLPPWPTSRAEVIGEDDDTDNAP
jgi:hypothetical protein